MKTRTPKESLTEHLDLLIGLYFQNKKDRESMSLGKFLTDSMFELASDPVRGYITEQCK